MERNDLLESYLCQLRLPSFVRSYQSFATDGTRSNLDYTRYLLALAEQEVNKREQNRIQKRVKVARFPVLTEQADLDFSALTTLKKAQVLDLFRREYIRK